MGGNASTQEYTELVNGKFLSHISYSTGGARADSFEIKCPCHILNGKRIVRNVWTQKIGLGRYGKPEVYFMMADSINGKEYKTVNGLLKAHGLPQLKKEK